MVNHLPAPQEGGGDPQFSAHVYCPQRAEWIKMALGMEVGLSPGQIVLDGDQAQLPSPKRGYSPQFAAYVYCGQTAGWIKMPLGTDVGLGPGYIVLDEGPAPQKRAQLPQFSAHVCGGQTAVCISIPLGTEVRLSLGDIVLDGDPAPPPQKNKGHSPSNFWPMSIVAKRLDGSRCHLVQRWASAQATLC